MCAGEAAWVPQLVLICLKEVGVENRDQAESFRSQRRLGLSRCFTSLFERTHSKIQCKTHRKRTGVRRRHRRRFLACIRRGNLPSNLRQHAVSQAEIQGFGEVSFVPNSPNAPP